MLGTVSRCQKIIKSNEFLIPVRHTKLDQANLIESLRSTASAEDLVKPSNTEDPSQCFADVRLLSPQEMELAFVKAAWRDRDDDEKMEEWKKYLD